MQEILGLMPETGSEQATGMIVIGFFLLAGFVANVLGRRMHVPRVTLMLVLGFTAGPYVFDLVPREASDWFPQVSRIALSLIGFQLGERFLGKKLRQTGRTVMAISLGEVAGAALSVFLVLFAFGVPLPLSLMLAAVAPATAPAATLDVIRESEAKGPVSEAVLGIVAIDDAWGVLLFSVVLVVAQVVGGQEASAGLIWDGVREVGGGVLLGALVGLPMAYLTGRVRPGELTLLESLGFVFLCSGLAIHFEFSHILACMAMGATVSNVARHHERPFHAIEEIEQPFLIVFFLLAGFNFDVGQLWHLGLIGVAYALARSAGLIGGAYVSGFFSNAPTSVRKYAGFCLLPQAGVALGLSLLVSERDPELGSKLLAIIVGTTIIFELVGPIILRVTLQRAGEIPKSNSADE